MSEGRRVSGFSCDMFAFVCKLMRAYAHIVPMQLRLTEARRHRMCSLALECVLLL